MDSKLDSPRFASAVSWFTLVCLCILTGILLWNYGGMGTWSKPSIYAISAILLLVSVFTISKQGRMSETLLKVFTYTSPLLLLTVLPALVSLTGKEYDAFRLTLTRDFSGIMPAHDCPVTADKKLTWETLAYWLCLSSIAFATLTGLSKRKHLRYLLIFIVLNVAILALYGSIIKLSPWENPLWEGYGKNPKIFATFRYQNHYAASAILALCCALGLLHRALDRYSIYHLFTRTFYPLLMLVTLLIMTSIVLALSRSGTIILGILMIFTLGLFCWKILRNKKIEAGKRLGAIAAALLIFTGSCSFIFYLESDKIENYYQSTYNNWVGGNSPYEGGYKDLRFYAYEHTLEMIVERPAFGWGLGNFQRAFPAFQKEPFIYDNNLPRLFFRNTHNDWLEITSETGLIGLSGVLLSITGIILYLKRTGVFSVLPRWLFGALLLLSLYAIIDYPFGNPSVTCIAVIVAAGGLRDVTLLKSAMRKSS